MRQWPIAGVIITIRTEGFVWIMDIDRIFAEERRQMGIGHTKIVF